MQGDVLGVNTPIGKKERRFLGVLGVLGDKTPPLDLRFIYCIPRQVLPEDTVDSAALRRCRVTFLYAL